MSKDANYRYAGLCGDCCGICIYNQRNDEAEDYCEQGEAPWPAGPADDHVCDSFKLEAGSMRLSDVKPGMDLEVDIDEPYRGNVYAGPYKVRQVDANRFTYLHNGRPVSKYAPLRGYKPVNPPDEPTSPGKTDDPVSV
jgi:hypothetical protein